MATPEPVCSGMYDWSTCGGDADGGIDPTGNPPPDHDFDLGGCNAGGSASGLLVVLALLAVRRRRTR
jgi:uncharacterized protein (TIGR03382 family)